MAMPCCGPRHAAMGHGHAAGGLAERAPEGPGRPEALGGGAVGGARKDPELGGGTL